MSLKDKIKGFLNGIVATLGEKVVAQLIKKYLTKENIISAVDGALDFLEELAEKSETEIDDKVLASIRSALNIPDGEK